MEAGRQERQQSIMMRFTAERSGFLKCRKISRTDIEKLEE